MKRNGILGSKREGGFTLVELLVVMSILAVLAAVVVPMVTGVNTTARNTAQPTDIGQLSTAVNNFNGDSATWPTKASSGAAAGALPATTYWNSGTTYSFTVASIAGLALTSTYGAKTFVPDYSSNPKHASDAQISVANGGSRTYTVNKGGVTNTVILSNTNTGSAETFDAWGLDSKGGIWVFVDKDSY